MAWDTYRGAFLGSPTSFGSTRCKDRCRAYQEWSEVHKEYISSVEKIQSTLIDSLFDTTKNVQKILCITSHAQNYEPFLAWCYPHFAIAFFVWGKPEASRQIISQLLHRFTFARAWDVELTLGKEWQAKRGENCGREGQRGPEDQETRALGTRGEEMTRAPRD